jgi:hypothetical protein
MGLVEHFMEPACDLHYKEDDEGGEFWDFVGLCVVMAAIFLLCTMVRI